MKRHTRNESTAAILIGFNSLVGLIFASRPVDVRHDRAGISSRISSFQSTWFMQSHAEAGDKFHCGSSCATPDIPRGSELMRFEDESA